MESQSQPKVELDYGLPPRLHQRIHVQRWLIRGAVAVVVLAALATLPFVFKRSAMLYWQAKCLNYVVAVDRPVGNAGQPQCYADFIAAFGAGQKGDVVFLHEMQGGEEPLLVCVSVDRATTQKTGHPCLCWDTFHPVSFLDGTRRSESSQFSAYTGLPLDAKFYGGRIDPDDLKHLTIEYEADGKRGVIDGWLFVDNLRIQPREAPKLFQ